MSEEGQLGEKVQILSGFAFPSRGFTVEDGLPLVRIRDIASGKTEVNFRGPFDPAFLIKNGDVLIGMDGDFLVSRWLGEDALLNQRVCKVTSLTASVDQAFLFWFLQPHIDEIHRKTPQTTVRHLSTKDVKAIPAPAMSGADQSKIAEILDTLDAAIRGTEAVVAKLKAMKQGLLHDLLTRGIDANGDLRPPQPEAPHLYKQTPLGWLPKEWDVDHLSTFASVHGGKRLPAGHAYANGRTGFKYLRVTDFFGKSVKIDDLEDLEERTFAALARYEITAGQLYISIAGSLGHVGVFPQSPDEFTRTILTENAARIVLQKDGNPEFLSMMMNSGAVQQQVEWEKGTGGGVPKLALFRIAQFYIGFPALPEQDAITRAYHEMGEREVREQQLLDKLRLQKSGLMDDLLTGKTPVTALL